MVVEEALDEDDHDHDGAYNEKGASTEKVSEKEVLADWMHLNNDVRPVDIG